MRSRKPYALIEGQLAHYAEDYRLSSVYKVELVACLVFLPALKLLEARSLSKSDSFDNCLALGLGRVKIGLVVLAEIIGFFDLVLFK